MTLHKTIVLDTETTGLSPHSGHRIIEIGCIEMSGLTLTGNQYHVYINPDRDVPFASTKVHGITAEYLRDKPRFYEIVEDFLQFILNAQLVIHNADFDIRFINSELSRLNISALTNDKIVDTLGMARKKFPGSKASLDALCNRFGISLSNRKIHGALLDAKLLAQVYVAMSGGDQSCINFENIKETISNRKYKAPRHWESPSQQELIAHREFMKRIKQ